MDPRFTITAQMRLRVKSPTGSNSTLEISSDENVCRLKEMIGAMLNIENSNDLVLLVGFPPRALVAEDVTLVSSVLKDGEVIVIKQTQLVLPPPAQPSGSARRWRQPSNQPPTCPPGIDEETWSNLDEETRRELSMSFEDDDDYEEDEHDEVGQIEEDEVNEENGNMNERDAKRLAEMHRHMQNEFEKRLTAPSNMPRTATDSKATQKKSGGISFGARVATLSSNGQASSVQRTSFGPGSQPRTFGAR